MDLSERLRTLRKSSGKTQKEVSDELKVKETNYNKWENRKVPNLETICLIANYYKTSVDYLIGNSNNRYKTKEAAESVLIEKETEILEKLEICKTEIKELNEMFEEALFLFNMRN